MLFMTWFEFIDDRLGAGEHTLKFKLYFIAKNNKHNIYDLRLEN